MKLTKERMREEFLMIYFRVTEVLYLQSMKPTPYDQNLQKNPVQKVIKTDLTNKENIGAKKPWLAEEAV